jgi:hypothetical protein
VATEQDAARDRVLAARADLAEELERLEASARAAVDIPAKIKRSPAKAAALVAGVGFLALKGPQRLFRAARQAIRGEREPLPSRLLPDEVEKTLRKLGDDGEKVRGALERDFAEYAKKSQKDRQAIGSVLLLTVARPLLARAVKSVGDAIFSPDPHDFATRLSQVRDRAGQGIDRSRDAARDRIAAARRDDADHGTPASPADETAPTGI